MLLCCREEKAEGGQREGRPGKGEHRPSTSLLNTCFTLIVETERSHRVLSQVVDYLEKYYYYELHSGFVSLLIILFTSCGLQSRFP